MIVIYNLFDLKFVFLRILFRINESLKSFSKEDETYLFTRLNRYWRRRIFDGKIDGQCDLQMQTLLNVNKSTS